MHTRNFLGPIAFLGLLSNGCSDTSPPSSTSPVTIDGRVPAFSATASTPKVILPTGKGIDVAVDPSPPGRTRNRMDYHNGTVMVGTSPDVYFVLYASWGNPD